MATEPKYTFLELFYKSHEFSVIMFYSMAHRSIYNKDKQDYNVKLLRKYDVDMTTNTFNKLFYFIPLDASI
jgi:hypothetical protein